jgi:predicted nucleotidyltransferase
MMAKKRVKKKVKRSKKAKKISEKKILEIKKKLEKGKELTKKDIDLVKKYREQKREESPLAKFLPEKDVKAIDKYVTSVLAKFGKYIKAMAVWGSMKTGVAKKKTSDIDIGVIVDDTDVTRMTRGELKEKLFHRLIEKAHPISKKIHPQPYLLTEFWEYVREGNPVIYNLLRDGVIVFDTGYLLPIQMLQKMGNISPSKERIDKNIMLAPKLLKSAQDQLNFSLSHAVEQAVVASAQALLMELGYRPPAVTEVPIFVDDFLVKKHKIVSKEYTKIAKDVITTYKAIEHKVVKELKGAKFDQLIADANKFVDKMKDELIKLRKKKGETFLFEYFEKAKKKEKKKKKTKKRDEIGSVEKRKIEGPEKMIKEGLGQR